MEVGEKLGQILSRKPQISSTRSGELEERLATSCRQFFAQKIEFTAAKGPDSHLEHLKSRYTPLNKGYKPLSAMESPSKENVKVTSSESDVSRSVKKPDGVPEPKMVLYTASQLVMGWREARPVGCGLCNLGNTCFLNSVLQCLTYTPPLFNYVASGQHSKTCTLIFNKFAHNFFHA
jgi:ubiquitin carboxyl-terminal hydrolase 36/42